MRFLSKSQGYEICARQPVIALIQGPRGPEEKTLEDHITARFEQGGLTEYEKRLAKERFVFKGAAEGEDPLRRVSIYDTDEEARRHGWSAELKAEVEQNLIVAQDEWYFLVEDEKAPKPWPTYDEQSIKQILDTVEVTGVDPEAVIAYERENKNRASIIEPLQVKLAEDAEVVAA